MGGQGDPIATCRLSLVALVTSWDAEFEISVSGADLVPLFMRLRVIPAAYLFTSDKATLSDMRETSKVGRFRCCIVD